MSVVVFALSDSECVANRVALSLTPTESKEFTQKGTKKKNERVIVCICEHVLYQKDEYVKANCASHEFANLIKPCLGTNAS